MENAVRLGQVPLGDLVELRVVLEGASVEAAAMAAAEALESARSAVEAMKAPGIDVESFRAADVLFHRSLSTASGNVAFPLVMGVLRSAISSHLGEALHDQADVAATMKRLTREHEAILKAVEGGQGERARMLMTKHIRAFYRERGDT
jgi:DNA-binding FadR family transcriptional regulator